MKDSFGDNDSNRTLGHVMEPGDSTKRTELFAQSNFRAELRRAGRRHHRLRALFDPSLRRTDFLVIAMLGGYIGLCHARTRWRRPAMAGHHYLVVITAVTIRWSCPPGCISPAVRRTVFVAFYLFPRSVSASASVTRAMHICPVFSRWRGFGVVVLGPRPTWQDNRCSLLRTRCCCGGALYAASLIQRIIPRAMRRIRQPRQSQLLAKSATNCAPPLTASSPTRSC